MKKAFLICLSALVLMAFSSCSDSDDEANQTKPADMVRLVSFHNELVKGMFVLTTHLDNVWENGRLMRQTQIASALGKSVEVGEVFTYNERGLCTEMYTVDSNYHHYYTYTSDGRIAKEVFLSGEDTLEVTEVLAYDTEGNIAEMVYAVPDSSVIRRSRLTWKDGDLVKAVVEYVTEGRETDNYTFTYDNYPSAYAGYPIAIGIHDVTFLAMHSSKHNQIEPGFTPTYENGRLVLLTSDDGNDNTYFTYDDGTGKR